MARLDATQRNIRNYDPRYLSVSFEVQTYDQDALLFLALSDDKVSSKHIFEIYQSYVINRHLHIFLNQHGRQG